MPYLSEDCKLLALVLLVLLVISLVLLVQLKVLRRRVQKRK
jgi:hypothetical protein